MRLITLLVTLSLFSFGANAATYYVKNGGSNAADGLTDATAWETIGKVNGFTFAAGDDIYFKAGDSWALEKLTIDHDGVSTANPSIYGAYNTDSGSEVIGVGVGVGLKPIIAGGYVSTLSIGTVPSSIYSGLIKISGSYITVENLHIKDSSGYGIVVDSAGSETDIIIDSNTIDHVVGGWVLSGNTSTRIQTSNNTMTEGAWAIVDGISPYGSHPGGISYSNTTKGLIENNDLTSCECEGIALWNASDNNTVRGNVIKNPRYLGVYIDDSSENVIEGNIVVGVGDGTVARTKKAFGSSIEGRATNTSNIGNIFRNNLGVNTDRCFYTNVELEARNLGLYIADKFVYNTCVGNDTTIELGNAAAQYGATMEIANNIFWETSTGAAGCISPTSVNITMHHNSWYANPTDADCDGTGDVYGDPTLSTATSFLLYTSLNMPTFEDVRLATGSAALAAGDPMITTPTYMTTINYPLYNNFETPCSYTANWLEKADEDFECTDRDDTSPDIGAVENVAGAAGADITTPFYMNVGTTGEITPVSTTWIAYNAAYFTYTCAEYSDDGTVTTPILGTSEDELYQAWYGCNGTITIKLPIANGTWDLKLYFTEEYWINVLECGGRRFDISVENISEENEYNNCPTGVGNTANIYTKSSIVIDDAVDDGFLTITLSKGTTGSLDNKPELMGISVVAAVPLTPGTLSVGDTSPTVNNILNQYSSPTTINPATYAIASTTTLAGVISISGTPTNSLTCGTFAVSEDNINILYTPANANANEAGCGSLGITLTDGEDSQAITLNIGTIVKKPFVNVYMLGRGWPFASTTGWECKVYDSITSILGTPIYTSSNESTDSDGKITLDVEGMVGVTCDNTNAGLCVTAECYNQGPVTANSIPYKMQYRRFTPVVH